MFSKQFVAMGFALLLTIASANPIPDLAEPSKKAIPRRGADVYSCPSFTPNAIGACSETYNFGTGG
ncbi:hypothetical protein LTR27_005980 [Elasticomyces elasticus]|nr:hypothetical protein LTR27_005980 [Elasticomyces elasticus]